MALTLGDNFSYQGAKPLDGRIKYDTLADMKAVADSTMYEGCLGYCVADGKTYQWKSTNTVDSTTGKWREFTSGGGGGASDLSDLGDVDLNTPSDGQFLKYDGTSGKWINANGGSVSVAELGDIGDVDLTSVQDGQIIKWDAANSKWVNADIPSGVDDLSDLSDVDLSTPTDGQVLTYDATNQVWKNASGGSATVDHLGDITDVDLTNIVNGQMIVWDATNSKWVNANVPSGGASDLDDLGDVEITSPSNGDVLKYNSTSQKWENGEGGGGSGAIVNGYAYTEPFDSTNAMDYIKWVRNHTSKELKVSSESLFSNKTCNCFYTILGPTYGYVLFSEYDFSLLIYRLTRSGHVICNSSRHTTDGVNHPGYNSNGTFQLTNGITSLNAVTIKGTSEVDADYIQDDDKVAEIFISESVTIDANIAYADRTTVIKNDLVFYEDSAHTTAITPETGKIYVDTPTGDTYEWDGTEYKKIGGGTSGATSLDELDDVVLNSPSNDQILTYDSSAQKWKNANGAAVAHLSDITDVDINDIADGQMIAWDETNSKWVNVTPSGGASDLDDLTDVDITSAANGDVLKYNSTTEKWENGQGGGGSTYTAGDGIDITNDVISTDNLQSGDMADVITPLPPTSGDRGIVYSTTEQVIGTWIDGKPIYQKTVELGNLPNSTTKNVAHGITNIDKIVEYFGVGIDSSGETCSLPRISLNTSYFITADVDKTNIIIQSSSNQSGRTGYLTIKYTKTTD